MPKHGAKAKRRRIKERRAPEVLDGEYEPHLRAMGEKGRQGEVEEEERERS